MADPWADLPLWMRAGPFVTATVCPFLAWLGVAALAGGVAGFPLWRTREALPWTERARLAWPVRRVAGLVTVLAIFVPMAGVLLVDGVLLPAPPTVFGALAVAAGVVGAAVGLTPARRWVWGPGRPVARRLRSTVTNVLAFYPHLVAVSVLAASAPATLDRRAAAVLLAGTVLTLASSRGDHLGLLRILGLSAPATGRVAAVVGDVGLRVGHRPAAVDVLDTDLANAAAFPPGDRVFVTRALVEETSEVELAAVVAHEIAHLTEPRAVVGARVAGALAFSTPLLLAKPLGFGIGPWAPLVAIFVGLVAAVLVSRFARRMEVRADAQATAHEGDPGAYAHALEAIYRHNLLPAVMPGRRRVHPHLYDRLVAAGVPPAWERPAPPSRVWTALGLLVAVGAVYGALLGGIVAAAGLGVAAPATAATVRLALGIGVPRDLTDLALDRFDQDDLAGAARLYAAAAAAEPASPWAPANLSLVLAAMDRCPDAARAGREARARSADALPDPAFDTLLLSVDEGVRVCFGANPDAAPPDNAPAEGYAPPPAEPP